MLEIVNIFIGPYTNIMCFIITKPYSTFSHFFYIPILDILLNAVSQELVLYIILLFIISNFY